MILLIINIQRNMKERDLFESKSNTFKHLYSEIFCNTVQRD